MWEEEHGPLRRAIQDGSIEWVTILVQNNANMEPSASDVATWAAETDANHYGHTLAETDGKMSSLRGGFGGFPAFALISPGFGWDAFDDVLNSFENRSTLVAAELYGVP